MTWTKREVEHAFFASDAYSDYADENFTNGEADYEAAFEHDQWWVTCLPTGRVWSVVERGSSDDDTFLDFEVLEMGEEP